MGNNNGDVYIFVGESC